jgi:protocatechuate 3,4-dioxygenase beta subunit
MKNLIAILCFICFVSSHLSLKAQDSAKVLNEIPNDFKKRSPIYDYSENQLNNIDTIPEFETKANKLKITGTIFQNDGVTPAKDVMLYIEQADENGDYQIKTQNDKRYLQQRGWVKTNADGQYTLYTFVPGSAIVPITLPRRIGPKQIYPVIKEPGKEEYNLEAFLFDDDPLLTNTCRKRLKRKGIDCILKLEKKEDMYVVTKNIVLDQTMPAYNK